MVYDSQINPAPGSTSSGLLHRVKAGQAEAWGRLIDIYAPLIYDWCRHSGLQSQDAADVGQEVFATVARRIAEFRKEQPTSSFRGWLWTVTRNKIRDHFRGGRGIRRPAVAPTLSSSWPPSRSRPQIPRRP